MSALLSWDFSEIEARNKARVAAQEAYNVAIQQGKSDTEALAIAQEVLRQAEAAGTGATIQNTTVTALNNQAMSSRAQLTRLAAQAAEADAAALTGQIAKTLGASIESQTLAARQAELMQAVQAAAGGMLVGADNAAVLARQLGITADQAAGLISRDAGRSCGRRPRPNGHYGIAGDRSPAWAASSNHQYQDEPGERR